MHIRAFPIIGAIAAALMLSACSPAAPQAESARQADAFPEVYAQTIDWVECNDGFDFDDGLKQLLASIEVPVDTFRCAMVQAPLDWNDPASDETIELAVTHIPSSGEGEKIGTLMTNPGGPGSGGVSFAYQLSASPALATARERYDMLGFDPRGIGRSTPLDCDPGVSTLVEVRLAICAEENPLAASMGTSQVARDMDLLRHLMNDDLMHYVGYSYGTTLGATYSTLFPERVGRMILDGASSPDWASPIGTFNQAFAIAREMVALVEGCGTTYATETCPATDEETLLEQLTQLKSAPLLASDGTMVDDQKFSGYLTTALYQRTAGRERVLETAGLALSGSQEQIDLLAQMMSDGGSSVSLVGKVVKCHSFPADANLTGLLERIEETGLPRLLGGPELTDEALKPFADLACDAVPWSGDDILDGFTGSPNAPILVIGITGDHATPYEGGQWLTEQLGNNARLLTLEGSGHTVALLGRSTCVDDAALAYLLDGELPEENSVCQYN